MRLDDITFVILTKNEAANIDACLASLPASAQRLVYDAESSDATVTLARALGARVHVAPWQGFVTARRAAAALVITPWTFMLDADERLSDGLRAELEAFDPPEDIVGATMPRRNHVAGHWIKGAGWYPDLQLRLFRTGRAQIASRSPGELHERWSVDGQTVRLRCALDHYSYRTLDDYWSRFARYTELEASARPGSALRAAVSWLVFPVRFVWLFLWRGGLFDGPIGWHVALGSALYRPVTERKAWRRSRSTHA